MLEGGNGSKFSSNSHGKKILPGRTHFTAEFRFSRVHEVWPMSAKFINSGLQETLQSLRGKAGHLW